MLLVRSARHLASLALVVASAVALLACDGGTSDGSGPDSTGGSGTGGQGNGLSCVFEGETYADGESIGSGCGACACIDGAVLCPSTRCIEGCNVDGAFYAQGDTVPSGGCDGSCFCGMDNEVHCDDDACLTCPDLESFSWDALQAAKACDPTQPNQCTKRVQEKLGCGCDTFVNPENESAIARFVELQDDFIAAECDYDIICEQCATPMTGVCNDDGQCEDDFGSDGGAPCIVNHVQYESGALDIDDPASCNTCACLDGQLACTEQDCPETACPPNAVFGSQCLECGATDECLAVEYTCLPVCAEGCVSGVCLDGVCKNVCG
jgi:hypothetical protein